MPRKTLIFFEMIAYLHTLPFVFNPTFAPLLCQKYALINNNFVPLLRNLALYRILNNNQKKQLLAIKRVLFVVFNCYVTMHRRYSDSTPGR